MSGTLCTRCHVEPTDPTHYWPNVCRKCRRDYNRAYMRAWRSRHHVPKRTNWNGLGFTRHKKRYVWEEAKARGVPVETVIQEWGLRK